jgi:hypothetical protein
MFLKRVFPLQTLIYLTAAIGALLCVEATAFAQDPIKEIPEAYRGTWVLRLTSDDAGKTYKSGGNMPICEVTAKEIKFTTKVAYSDEKLTVKSVAKKEAPSKTNYAVTFDNGKVWILEQNGANITAVMHDSKDEMLTETYRITVRKK